MKTISFGGGAQSMGLMVLAARREIPHRRFLFANVGHDSEDPRTLDYVDRVAAPYARANGLDLHILDRVTRTGRRETLWGRLMRPGSRSLPIPVRMSNGAPGTRSCTKDFKIAVTGRWLREHGASPQAPAEVGIGISLDEISRASNRRVESYERITYPLLDLRMRRADCLSVIADEGLEAPAKSACWFCPLKSRAGWSELLRDRPVLFERACELEETLNARRAALGRDPVYLTRAGRPLTEAVGAAQEELPLDVGCDSGWCMT
ncbi:MULTISPECIES: phosphoadenosine phosphosulfate reductase [unclassified Streptomyces]|uniref:phosphoadenosine phosphosulfate reductase n=1 Tax=unclassified Streptomyces TaxID=2593676 RepID=UPI00226DB704|nr:MULTISPECIES: phosphoadenosine phosphosulfate reductase [unclassified Streptomyces]MCY0918293.1 phosphoadenosine phosphosulfate reductase [Streptomyces sp. H27-G5]MCY0957446.1 phosphoadenosine phosphosulfate reductase [Streptomyces sp. H27-H5]